MTSALDMRRAARGGARPAGSAGGAVARLALVVLLGAAATACGTARAAVPIERPPLEVPPVPPRVVEPVTLPPPAAPEPVPDLPAPPAGGTSRAKPAPQAAKPDPKVEAPPTEPPAAPPAQPSAPPLRTPGTPDANEATRRIREINGRAQGLLGNTDYTALTPERKAQYQNAQLLINQAEAAIKAANFEFARNLAEKAERLAKELQGR